MTRIRVIDSHTGGEPTRVVVAGGPDLGSGPLAGRLERFRSEFDHFRSATVNEPRGSDAMVGALLCQPSDPTCAAGVIFFNNVGYLGMCGHGAIGLVVTLAHMGRVQPGTACRLETPVGAVDAHLNANGSVTIRNVASYRHAAHVPVEAPGIGTVYGDIAWGGNWFFLCSGHGQELSLCRVDQLTDFAWRIRQGLEAQGIAGARGGPIDHIELFGPATAADSRNFVLCPGKAYDRSPCGTGTSAKLACLYADGKFLPGQIWRQESITGSVFEGTVRVVDGQIYPEITGFAYVNAEADLLLDPRDPFCYGIRGAPGTGSGDETSSAPAGLTPAGLVRTGLRQAGLEPATPGLAGSEAVVSAPAGLAPAGVALAVPKPAGSERAGLEPATPGLAGSEAVVSAPAGLAPAGGALAVPKPAGLERAGLEPATTASEPAASAPAASPQVAGTPDCRPRRAPVEGLWPPAST